MHILKNKLATGKLLSKAIYQTIHHAGLDNMKCLNSEPKSSQAMTSKKSLRNQHCQFSPTEGLAEVLFVVPFLLEEFTLI